MRILLPVLLALSTLASCDYEAPVDASYQPQNTISGTIIANGIDEPSDVIVLVFDALNPPPPIGTGSPVTFTTVPASEFTTDGAGLSSAPYALPYLADTNDSTGYIGGYLMTALMDTDANFNPFAPMLGGSSCTDWIGEHSDRVGSLLPTPLLVEGGVSLDNIPIIMSRQNPFERPAFTLPEGVHTLSKEMAAQSGVDPVTQTQTYRVGAVGIHAEYDGQTVDYNGPCPISAEDADTCFVLPACDCDPVATQACETAIWMHFVDADADGEHDPHPSELQAAGGLKDTWPKVYLEYLGQPVVDGDVTLGFVNEYASGSFEWPVGSGRFVPERWVGENYPSGLELNVFGAAGIAPYGATFSTFPAREASVTFSPAFRHYHADGQFAVDPASGPFDLVDLRCFTTNGVYPEYPTCTGEEVSIGMVPSGAYSLTVILENGQTWTIPNEGGIPGIAQAIGLDEPPPSTDASYDPATQGAYLMLE